jgi:integrase/recombinase XerD
MTQLRQRMSEDLQLRGLSARTQERSVRAVRQLAEHDHKSPDRITEAERRDDFLDLKNVTHDSRSASTIALCGLTCFSEPTVPRPWTTLTCVRPPRAKTLPVIRSRAEVRTMLAHLKRRRSRVCLTTIYAGGRRLQAGTHLQVPDIDRARRLVHVRAGTGAKDRDVPLPRPTLEWRRQDWNVHRHPVGLLPAPGRGGTGMATATTPRPSSRGPDACRAARNASGLHTRASVHTLRHRDATPLLAAGVNLRRMPAYGGHHAPTTTARSTPLTLKADARARAALHRLMADRSRHREVGHGRASGHLPASWTSASRHMPRPHASEPLGGHGGQCTLPYRSPGRPCLPGHGVRGTGGPRAFLQESALSHVPT